STADVPHVGREPGTADESAGGVRTIMSAAEPTIGPIPLQPAAETPIGLAAQLRICSAMFVAGLIFWSVGWRVWQPADPRGPVLLYGASHPFMTVILMAFLAVVAAGLAVIIAGRSPA